MNEKRSKNFSAVDNVKINTFLRIISIFRVDFLKYVIKRTNLRYARKVTKLLDTRSLWAIEYQ